MINNSSEVLDKTKIGSFNRKVDDYNPLAKAAPKNNTSNIQKSSQK